MPDYPLPSVKVDCGDYAIEGEDGAVIHPRQGEWVRFRRKVSGRMIKLMLRIMRLRGLPMEDDSALNEFEQSLDEIVPHLARSVIDWTLTDFWQRDEEGKSPLLPPPSPDVVWDLDYQEIFYLVSKLFGQLQAPKN